MSLTDFNIPKLFLKLLAVVFTIAWITSIVIVVWVAITLGIAWIKEGWVFW